jgi:alpha-tubulin suppressor-like RCC1 family protein
MRPAALALALAPLAAAACLDPQDLSKLIYACNDNSDCPPDQVCRSQRCAPAAEPLDGGPHPDASTDASVTCGNGVLDPGEDCDQGPDTAACNHCQIVFGWSCNGAFGARSMCTNLAFKDLAVGTGHVCGLTTDGRVYCAGSDQQEPSAHQVKAGQRDVPPGLPTASGIYAGENHTCATTGSATTAAGLDIICWGSNQIWTSSTVSSTPNQATVPSDLRQRLGGPIAAFSVGINTNCALSATGLASCWGENEWGEASPSPLNRFSSIVVGGAVSCGLDRGDAHLVCWGYWSTGTPTTAGFIAVAPGFYHTCAIDSGHRLVCWGKAGGPNGVAGGRTDPPAGNDFVAVSSGHYQSCARRMNGDVVCWGYVAPAQSRGETASPSSGPYLLLRSNDQNNCVLQSDGSPVCWGVLNNPITPSTH